MAQSNTLMIVMGRPLIVLISGTLVYYHCSYRNSSVVSLLSDVFIVLLCSLAILGLLFRHMNVAVPVDPLEWQISQEAANSIFACLANTVGAAESVLRVAATGHDKRLFFKVVACLYILSAIGRVVSGVTVAYVGRQGWVGGESTMMFSKELEKVQFGFRVNVASCAHIILVLGVPGTGNCRLLASATEFARAKPGPSGTFQHPNS